MRNQASIPITKWWHEDSGPVWTTLTLDSCEFVSIRGSLLHGSGLRGVPVGRGVAGTPDFQFIAAGV